MDDLLLSWGFSGDVIEAFTLADVTVQSIIYLNDSAIQKLIPALGPRCMFTHHLNEYKSKLSTTASLPSTSGGSPLPFASTPEQASASEPPRKRARLAKTQLMEILNAPDINELHAYLKKSIPGLVVLGFYKAKSYLDDYTRDLLSQESVYKELNPDVNKSLTRDDFSCIADTIVELFPTETKVTWYDVVTKSKRSVVEGRLRHKWYAIRRGLSSALLVPKETRSSNRTVDSSDEDTDVEDNAELQLLLNNVTNWKDAEDAWEATVIARGKILKQCDYSTYSYISKFPCLERNLGWKLLADDAERKEPRLKEHRELWDSRTAFLVDQIRTVCSKFSVSTISDDIQFMNIVLQLPQLWRRRHIAKSTKAAKSANCWRPSEVEIRDSLCLHVLDIALIRNKVDERKKVLLKYCYELQPVAVVVGPLDNISQSFILLDDFRWEVSSPIEAFFGVMKICFALGSYPIESRHVWLYLQKVIFKIDTPQDYAQDRGLRSFLAARLNSAQ